MLSSDILEQQFGETRLIILYQDQSKRIIETISTSDESVLELSIVTFDTATLQHVADVHQTVMNGVSMGKAFKNAGIQFEREVSSIVHSALPPDLVKEFDDDGIATIVDVDIFVGDSKQHYCHILETYSPKVIWPE